MPLSRLNIELIIQVCIMTKSVGSKIRVSSIDKVLLNLRVSCKLFFLQLSFFLYFTKFLFMHCAMIKFSNSQRAKIVWKHIIGRGWNDYWKGVLNFTLKLCKWNFVLMVLHPNLFFIRVPAMFFVHFIDFDCIPGSLSLKSMPCEITFQVAFRPESCIFKILSAWIRFGIKKNYAWNKATF